MLIQIFEGDNLPPGLYALMNVAKIECAKSSLPPSATSREVLLEYDKIGGLIVNTTTGKNLPIQSLWNMEKTIVDNSAENLSDDELLVIIRRAENTDVPGSRYQKAKTEWDIRHQKATLEAMKDNKSSFVRIAPGANVKGLTMKGNTMVGKGNFLENGGSLEDAHLEGNRHYETLPTKIAKEWYEKPLGMIFIGVCIAVIAGGILVYLNWN